ncbi:hypothetical protein [Wenyingzhuangia sp. 2_MG-2023]|uniref:hypothetical protein n=1 Tax=Wenyingzhuangia sp. 2_MG-2023 TaxID=3062639 RepID=UPI0026E15BD9|nr:hypothetical protein [Wenyingzhuangia sp. 2_MG-2023]MDO6739129.1 hypothetical protein [Wenyingzhuangia sp. 2_MG-2023]MDO6803574.1 hypothetical protein [Wenyingzhuangia sp. 1_MG-2023]
MMHKILLLIFVLFMSCNQDKSTQTDQVIYTKIGKGILTGQGEEGISKSNWVVTNEKDWNHLKAKMNTINQETSHFTETQIDFSKYIVIATFDSIRQQGGSYISIANVVKNTSNTVVCTKYIEDNSPFATHVVNQSYHLVKIEKTNLPIIFE